MATERLHAKLADGRRVEILQPPGAPGDKEWNFAYHGQGQQSAVGDPDYDTALSIIVSAVERIEGSKVVAIDGRPWPRGG